MTPDRTPFDDKLHLPGHRSVWWVMGGMAVLLPFAMLLSSAPPDGHTSVETLRFQVRLRNVMWRMTQLGEVTPPEREIPADDSKQAKQQAKQQAEVDPSLKAVPTAPNLANSKEVMRAAIVELFDHADSDAGREMVVAHAIAVEAGETASSLASRLTRPSDAIRAALAATAPQRGTPPASPLAMAVTPASVVAGGRNFGGGWGPFIRARVRARVHALAGDRAGARKANDALAWSDETLLPLLYTLLQGLLMAGVFGLGIWFFGTLRVVAAGKAGTPRLDWLRGRHPGLGDTPAYLSDRLVPLLGFGAWLMIYLLAGVLIKMLPGPRAAVGFQVLFQALSGAVFAAWIISSFSRTALPLDAARLRTAASGVSAWRASTAALWAYSAVLPPMVVIALINMIVVEMIGMQDGAPHPVVGLLLEGGDPLQVAALGAAVVIGAPLGEELIFRAFLYRSLRRHSSIIVAACISGVVFSLVHMSPAAFLPYTTLGIAFALVFEWTGSLWASIILHGLWNAVVFGCMAVITMS